MQMSTDMHPTCVIKCTFFPKKYWLRIVNLKVATATIHIRKAKSKGHC